MSERRLFPARLSLLYGDMTFLSLAVLIFTYRRGNIVPPPFVLWAAGVAASLLVNTLILKKNGSVNASVFVTALFSVCMGAALAARAVSGATAAASAVSGATAAASAVSGAASAASAATGAVSVRMLVLIFLLGTVPIIHGSVLVHEKWNYHMQTLYMDGLAAASGFLLLVRYTGAHEEIRPDVQACLVWTLLSLALSVLVLMNCRLQDAGTRSAVPLLLFMGLCAVSCAAGLRFQKTAGRISNLFRQATGMLLRLLHAAGNILQNFMDWILRHFPLPQEEIILQEAPAQPAPMPDILPAAEGSGMLLPVILLCLAAAFASLWIWRRLHGLRWNPLKADSAAEQGIDQKNSGKTGRRHLAALAEKLVFFLRYLQNRNTPEGLLTYTEKKLSRTNSRRHRGETAAGFLRRVAGRLDGEEKNSADTLADVLEQMYYGEKKLPDLSPGFAALYRKAVKQAAVKPHSEESREPEKP